MVFFDYFNIVFYFDGVSCYYSTSLKKIVYLFILLNYDFGEP